MRPGDNLDGQFAEKIQKHCILYSVIAQSCHEVGMFRIILALSDETISQARNLFCEYASTIGVEVCLGDFEREMATLPGLYAPPGGRLLLAIEERSGSPEEAVKPAAGLSTALLSIALILWQQAHTRSQQADKVVSRQPRKAGKRAAA